mgnify:CR=1 FL=1
MLSSPDEKFLLIRMATNYSVKDEILKISNSMSIFGIKSVNKDQVVSLIANYITLYTKNRIC